VIEAKKDFNYCYGKIHYNAKLAATFELGFERGTKKVAFSNLCSLPGREKESQPVSFSTRARRKKGPRAK
jgi:hypothetical protein